MSSNGHIQKEILDHPTHIIQEIIKSAKRKLKPEEQKELVEFITSRGILIDTPRTYINYTKSEKVTIHQGSRTLIDQFKIYKDINKNKVIEEDIEMDAENNSTATTNKTFSEEEVLQLISAALQRQQQQPQLQQQQQQLSNQVRIPTPPTYDGSRDITKINNWYTSVEHYLNFYNFERARWVSYAVSLLTDNARLWYYRMAQRSSHDLSDWEVFKVNMDMEFKPKFTLQSTRDRLFNLKQTSSVQHYIKEFQDVLLELDITEDEAMDKFARGLKDRARAHILLKDPLDLESMFHCARTFESATQYGRSTSNFSSPTSVIDDPMDLSVIEIRQQNQLLLNLLKQQQGSSNNNSAQRSNNNCFYCDKIGHKKAECRNKKWDEDRGIFQSKRNNRNDYRTQKPRNNYNSNTNNYGTNNNNNNYRKPNNFRQQLNALLDSYDPLINNNTNDDHDNKNLIDLSSFDNQESYFYPVLSPNIAPETHTLSSAEKSFLNNVDNTSNALPLYKTMVGGSNFKILIDSGASTNYVHPKLLSHALTEKEVDNQAVETADGNKTNINKKITFRLFLGDNHEYQEIITAYVFESKFDIILGRNWLKVIAPKPDWFDDTWEVTDKNTNIVTKIYPVTNVTVMNIIFTIVIILCFPTFIVVIILCFPTFTIVIILCFPTFIIVIILCFPNLFIVLLYIKLQYSAHVS